MKFKRANYADKPRTDKIGKVCIKISLVEHGHRVVKGNLTKSTNVANSKVSDVFAAIEKALFS